MTTRRRLPPTPPAPSGNGEGSNQKLETPVEEGKQEKEQTVTGTGPETGEKKEPGFVPMGPEIIKGLKIDLEREASNIANNSIIKLYYAYARAIGFSPSKGCYRSV